MQMLPRNVALSLSVCFHSSLSHVLPFFTPSLSLYLHRDHRRASFSRVTPLSILPFQHRPLFTFLPPFFFPSFSSTRRSAPLRPRYKESGAPKIVRRAWKRGYARVRKVYYAPTWWLSGGKDSQREEEGGKPLVRWTNTGRRNHGTSKNGRWRPSDGVGKKWTGIFHAPGNDSRDSSPPSSRVSKQTFRGRWRTIFPSPGSTLSPSILTPLFPYRENEEGTFFCAIIYPSNIVSSLFRYRYNYS